MLLFNHFSSLTQVIATLAALLVAITIHEFAHAWTANYYGDPTAKLMGRLSFNPLVHLDLIGTIFLLVAGFGWGKPVMVNPNNFKNPKLDNITVSLAGPISNLLLAVIIGIILRFVPLPSNVSLILEIFVFFNLVLMIFNLIPIPPLDGSKILSLFISDQVYLVLQQFGIFLLLILILFVNFMPVISKIISFFFTLITGKALL